MGFHCNDEVDRPLRKWHIVSETDAGLKGETQIILGRRRNGTCQLGRGRIILWCGWFERIQEYESRATSTILFK